MKSVFALLVGLALAAFMPVRSAAAEARGNEEVKVVTQNYDFSGFDSIEASWVYKIDLTQSPSYSVRIEAPDFVVPYLRVEMVGDRLKLGVLSLPQAVQKKMNREEVRVFITMPELSMLQLSGASRFRANGMFPSRKGQFRLEMSGAANLISLESKANSAKVDCSGATRFNLKGEYDTMDMILSGAVEGLLAATSKKVFLNMSGASDLNMDLDAETVDLGNSGASNLSLAGKALKVKAEGSGASKIFAERMTLQDAEVNLSGASAMRVNASRSLTVDLSGSANCRYRNNPGLQIEQSNIARAASLTTF